jgi:membrane-associated phospholipid phosphatase
MSLLDKLVSMCPCCLFLLHLVRAVSSKVHRSIATRIVLVYCYSEALKRIFRRTRRQKSYEFRSWDFGPLSSAIGSIKGNYSFPSAHSLFFCMYFIIMPSLFTLVLLLLGSFSRVYYQHHTVSEVISGVALAFLFEICLRLFL